MIPPDTAQKNSVCLSTICISVFLLIDKPEIITSSWPFSGESSGQCYLGYQIKVGQGATKSSSNMLLMAHLFSWIYIDPMLQTGIIGKGIAWLITPMLWLRQCMNVVLGHWLKFIGLAQNMEIQLLWWTKVIVIRKGRLGGWKHAAWVSNTLYSM